MTGDFTKASLLTQGTGVQPASKVLGEVEDADLARCPDLHNTTEK